MRFIFKTDYAQDIRLARHEGHLRWYGLLALLLATAPLWLGAYMLSQLTQILIYGVVGLGLMLLAGFTGQFSLGHAAFLGIGAYTEAVLLKAGVPFPLPLVAAGALAAAMGVVIGLPALRVRGIYLAIATLSLGVVVEEVFARWDSVTGGNGGMAVPQAKAFGLALHTGAGFYFLCLLVALLSTLAVANLLRSPTGRAFVAVRDSEVSARCLGIHLARTKTLSFALSALFTGLAGALYAHAVGFLSPDQFGILQSIDLLLMVVIGGLGSLHGAFFGAIFLIAMPQAIAIGKDYLPPAIGQAAGLQPLVYGLALMGFVMFEPTGMYGRWLKIRLWFEAFPLYRRGMLRRQKAYQKTERVQ